jgi:hypothetical protein
MMRPGFGEFALLPACFGMLMFAVMIGWLILWVVIAWRFTQAHESIAKSMSKIAEAMKRNGGPGPENL